jgi:diguanylate cyclase (GGDEF)-like protein
MEVLVVSDDSDTRARIEETLKNAGYSVSLLDDADAASAALAEGMPPIVVLAWLRDEVLEQDLCVRIRERASRDKTFLLVACDESRLEPLLAAGADDCVRLPIDPRELALRARIAELRVQERAEQERMRETLAHNAFHDPLTGLPNRALFMDRLVLAAERLRRRGGLQYAVLFIDVDRFKQINDRFGHDVGDGVLVDVSRRLEHCLRPGDTIARIGGDEFTVLMENVREPKDTLKVADRIIEELSRPFELDGVLLDASASVGIALSSGQESTPNEVIKAADAALYRAKSEGRARREIYDEKMQDAADACLRTEVDLRAALERGEFRLHYQPLVEMESRRVSGFEALLRWKHPHRGMLAPPEFLSVAVDSGLIVPIGWWTLREAMRQLREWRDAQRKSKKVRNKHSTAARAGVGVNLSPRQFLHQDLPDKLQRLLKEHKLAPKDIWLEIKEETITDHTDSAGERLQSLAKLGVRVFLDDFGRGLSSFSHLHQCPLDTVKIDGAFTSSLDADGVGGAVLGSMVSVAQALGMRTVVECVETQDQLDTIQPFGSDGAQGFWFSKPLDAGEAQLLLEADKIFGG